MVDDFFERPYIYDSLESLGEEIYMDGIREIVENYNPKDLRCRQHHYTMLALFQWANDTHREGTADFIGYRLGLYK